MSELEPFYLTGPDGKRIRGDRLAGKDRQILFITGFLSKRWGNKSQALVRWCQEQGWGFCCYDVRGFGESEGRFSDYTLADWVDDARMVIRQLVDGPPLTLVGNSLGGWISWMMAQEHREIEELIQIAPAFNGMRERANRISAERRRAWQASGWMPWDDDPVHRDYPISWQWVEESDALWERRFERRRPIKTTILHGLQDAAIDPLMSWEFVRELLMLDPNYPIELLLRTGDHRLSSLKHLDTLRRLVLRESIG